MELELDGLTKCYRDKKAVDGFSYRLREGIYGLLGPNGSGKTTLTRMLADVLRPTSGSIRLDGQPSDRLDEAYRDLIGYLPQDFGCYKEFTAMDFLLYIASLKGLDKRLAKSRAEELMESVGLYDDRKRKLKTYSGGMKQRVGIAQALLNDPSILILDEPTAGLDPKERVRFRNLLGHFAGGRIILLSTHIVTDVEFIADTILLMKNGRLLQAGDVPTVTDTAAGRVWTLRADDHTAREIGSRYCVANMRHDGALIELRVVSDERPHPAAEEASPTLEDAYLYVFGEEAGR